MLKTAIYGLLRVALRGDDTPIGMCGVLKRDNLPDPDIGFSFLPAYWSQGYALEAATAVMRHARNVLHTAAREGSNAEVGEALRTVANLTAYLHRLIAVGWWHDRPF